jgi:hypothetical protein
MIEKYKYRDVYWAADLEAKVNETIDVVEKQNKGLVFLAECIDE